MEFSKDYKNGEPVVYLTVDENGLVQNVFATVGAAIDSVRFNAQRVSKDLIDELTPTKLKWHSITGDHSIEAKVCPICTDFTMDYMNRPRELKL